MEPSDHVVSAPVDHQQTSAITVNHPLSSLPGPPFQEKKPPITTPVRLMNPELWIFLCTYLETLSDFIKVWIALKLFREELPSDHPTFWLSLLQEFLSCRNKTLDHVSHVSHLIPYYQAQRPTAISDHFLLLRILFQRSKCNRSGCYLFFREIDNSLTACCYHPGKYVHRKYMSCCRVTSFKLPGCKRAMHDGTFYFMLSLQRPSPSPSLPAAANNITNTTATDIDTSSVSDQVTVNQMNSGLSQGKEIEGGSNHP